MKTVSRRLVIRTSVLVLVIVAHFVLLHLLATKNVVAVLLAAGQHSPRWALFVAGVFVAIRLVVVLLLPGAILARLGMWLFRRLFETRKLT